MSYFSVHVAVVCTVGWLIGLVGKGFLLEAISLFFERRWEETGVPLEIPPKASPEI